MYTAKPAIQVFCDCIQNSLEASVVSVQLHLTGAVEYHVVCVQCCELVFQPVEICL